MEKDVLYLEAIIKPLITYPDEMFVTKKIDERGILLTITVNREDMGKIIGKEGETARSIRRLMRQYGITHQSLVSIKIAEPTVN